MKTQYYTASSLDGFLADAHHSLDWLLQFGSVDETDYPAFLADVGALAMGASTYEWILRNDLLADQDRPKPWPYAQPTWVFSSRTLPRVVGGDVRFVNGDVRPVHAEMAEAARNGVHGRNLWIVGGGDLAGQFHDAGLLDEMIVTVAPVTLGSGYPLFPRALTAPPLVLRNVRTYGATFAQLTYEVPRTA